MLIRHRFLETLTVEVAEGVVAGVALPERDTLGEVEALAPLDSDAVGEEDSVLLPESVEEGVGGGVAVLLLVGDPVGVPVGVGAALALPLSDSLGVLEGLAPTVSVEDGVALSVLEADCVVLGVGAGVEELDPVGDPDGV